MSQYGPEFFRKYADLLNESTNIEEATPPATQPGKIDMATLQKAAARLEKLVGKIQDLGSGDDGMEWLDRLAQAKEPLYRELGMLWDDYTKHSDGMELLDEYLIKLVRTKKVNPNTVIQLANAANGIYKDAKFDINY